MLSPEPITESGPTSHDPSPAGDVAVSEVQSSTKRGAVATARPLKVLVPLIREKLDNAYSVGIDHYRAAGEMLLEAKVRVKEEGESWAIWLMNNFELSQRTANVYMSLAGYLEFQAESEERTDSTSDGNSQRAANPGRRARTLSDFTAPNRNRGHRPAWFQPVQEAAKRLDVVRLNLEYEDKLKENSVKRDLAFELIDIGFKVLATKLHPDKGGSTEAMGRLNEIRTSLRTCAEDQWKS